MARHPEFVFGIDQGTTATKGFQLHSDGDFVPLCSLEHKQIYPHAGWVEHDPLELLANVESALDYAEGAAGIGLDNRGETVVAWNADTGVPIYNAIVWQDNRTSAFTERLRSEGAESLTLSRAGLPLDPYFSASKLRWLLDNVPEAKSLAAQRKLRLGTSDAFFLDRLCGVYATDVTTASRTSLMNLATGEWDEELCRLFGIPASLLPPIRATTGEFGITRRNNIPLVASVVDQQAALFGHGCYQPGQTKITFGTGAFALTVTGAHPVSAPERGMLPTVAWRMGKNTTFALDGGVYNAASALNWARQLGLFSDMRAIASFEGASAMERGIVFVPALSGLACPYWDRSAAGMWLGMGLDTTPHDLVRAVLEGVALRSAQVIAAMNERVPLRGAISVDGGLVRNRYFVDFLARALGRTVVLPSSPDVTGLGVTQLAFVGAGLSPVEALPPVAAPDETMHSESPLSAELLARFDNAVERARHWRQT